MWRARTLGALTGAVLVGVVMLVGSASAQTTPPQQPAAPPAAPPATQGAAPPAQSAPVTAVAVNQSMPSIVAPSDYIIGPDDILSIVFWKDADMTKDVVVRPDGKISLPVLNELQAAGLTPEQLRVGVIEAATKFFAAPSVNVVVKEIRSRKVFITGEVAKPGAYALSGRMTVIQLIAMAGGLAEFAHSDQIAIVRTDDKGQSKRFSVNYKDIMKGKNMKQNIELQVGDLVNVP